MYESVRSRIAALEEEEVTVEEEERRLGMYYSLCFSVLLGVLTDTIQPKKLVRRCGACPTRWSKRNTSNWSVACISSTHHP